MNTYTQILRELAIEQNKHINDDVARQRNYLRSRIEAGRKIGHCTALIRRTIKQLNN